MQDHDQDEYGGGILREFSEADDGYSSSFSVTPSLLSFLRPAHRHTARREGERVLKTYPSSGMSLGRTLSVLFASAARWE